jgi:hypothetical protein
MIPNVTSIMPLKSLTYRTVVFVTREAKYRARTFGR